jgi:glutamine amidotransferase
MCRWVVLISSDNISLSDVFVAPSNALIHQSRDASFHPGYGEMNNSALNADGFGVGWYHSNIATIPVNEIKAADGTMDMKTLTSTPAQSLIASPPPIDPQNFRAAAVFKDVFPAWNNMNLRELCMATSSNCIMAHIRAASTGTGVSLTNCHPFKAGRLLFCHNGRIFGYQNVKRRFLAELNDEAFLHLRGTTDSECFFGFILTQLAKDGLGSPLTQRTPFGAQRLVSALKRALCQMERLLKVCGMDDGYSTCNFSLTDGETMVVTRYCDKSPDIPPPSLYYAYGSTLQEELTTTESISPIFSSKATSEEEKKDGSSTTSDEDDMSNGSEQEEQDGFKESHILLQRRESKPGKILEEVDATTATFVVSSDPLTRGHCWHKMPRNSIMWCTQGFHPELRLLKPGSLESRERSWKK